jgi:mannan endo-1,4-beta-mannosidase
VAAGDQIVATLDGVDIVYTIQAADLLATGNFYTQGAKNLAGAINASKVLDTLHNLPMNQVVFATEGLGSNVGAKDLLWVGISTRPQFTTAATVSVRFVPVHSAADAILLTVVDHTPDTLITVTEPIAAGTVLTTTIRGVASTYTVASGETADSIAGHVHSSLAPSHLWSTRIRANTITVINGTNATEVDVTVSMTPPVATEKANLYVSGRFLYDRHGNKVILRGVDYPLADDYNFPGSDFLGEIAKTGANAVRIEWYTNYTPDAERAAILTPEVLGGFLDECVAANVVPIVELADVLCPTDTSPLGTTIVPWWTKTEPDPTKPKGALDVLLPRQSCLILNLANELGEYQWADDPAASLSQFLSDYTTAIVRMRAAGYTLPLMIDAPDCGISLNAFTQIGAELVAADPLGNILLSTHAYWAGFDGTEYLAPAVAANLPIVFGEIANKQDEFIDGKTVYCYYDLDGTTQNNLTSTGFTYQSFLTTLASEEVGWLAWSWTDDFCSSRQMTPTGKFADLGTYGLDLVNNATYGLKATAVRITQ